MAREENLIPFNELTEEQHRKLASKGGKASVIARKNKKAMKEIMENLLKIPVNDENVKEKMREMGIDNEDINNQTAMLVKLMNKALKGDLRAIDMIREITGEKVVEVKVNQVTDAKVQELQQLLEQE